MPGSRNPGGMPCVCPGSVAMSGGKAQMPCQLLECVGPTRLCCSFTQLVLEDEVVIMWSLSEMLYHQVVWAHLRW